MGRMSDTLELPGLFQPVVMVPPGARQRDPYVFVGINTYLDPPAAAIGAARRRAAAAMRPCRHPNTLGLDGPVIGHERQFAE